MAEPEQKWWDSKAVAWDAADHWHDAYLREKNLCRAAQAEARKLREALRTIADAESLDTEAAVVALGEALAYMAWLDAAGVVVNGEMGT